jgi:hypothetical protein
MIFLSYIYRGKSRELRKIITAILKSWIAEKIKKINYVQDYSLENQKITKTEEKILLIHTQNENWLSDFLSKNFPQIEKIDIN